MEWSDDVENILENIRINSVLLSNYHKQRYYVYKSYLKYFKLPLIVLSSITSIASMGLSTYISQQDVSLIVCLLSLTSAVIASVEIYLGIQKSMEAELMSSKDFQLLGYEIFKTLSLIRENRSINGRLFLDEKFGEYIKLIENSKLVNSRKIKDALSPLPEPFKLTNSSPNSSPNSSINDIELGLELQSS